MTWALNLWNNDRINWQDKLTRYTMKLSVIKWRIWGKLTKCLEHQVQFYIIPIFFLIDNKSFTDEKEQCLYYCKLTALYIIPICLPINASEAYTWHYTFRVRLGPAFLLAFVKSDNFLAVNLNNQKNLKAEPHINSC